MWVTKLHCEPLKCVLEAIQVRQTSYTSEMADLFAGGCSDAPAPPIPTAATVQRTSSYCIPFHWNWKVYCVNVLWMQPPCITAVQVLRDLRFLSTVVIMKALLASLASFLLPARIDFTSVHSLNIVLDASLCQKLLPAHSSLPTGTFVLYESRMPLRGRNGTCEMLK
jgi:hypothetical protein